MLELTELIAAPTQGGDRRIYAEIELPCEHRQRSRQVVTLSTGEKAALLLDRGIFLRGGDVLSSEDGTLVRVKAAREDLYRIPCGEARLLARIAYHLGNRHVGMEVGEGEILIARDPVLKTMLQGLGVEAEEFTAPFEPEGGAYGHHGHHRHEASRGGRIHEYASAGDRGGERLAALIRLLDLASPSLPVGAFSYSQGLETAVELGWVRDRDSAKRWLRHMLTESAGRLEAPVWLRLYGCWKANDREGAARWNEYFLASRESSELRTETLQMGNSLHRLLKSLGDERVAEPPEIGEPSFPALFSWAVSAFGISAEEGLAAYLWSWLENQVMALMKAVPLGQTDGRVLLLELGEVIPGVALGAFRIEDDDLAASAPLGALASMLHETQYTRLFRS